MQYSEAIAVLRGIPLLCKLDPTKLKLIAFSSTYLTFDKGEELFHAGDPADGAYIIKEGRVDVLAGEDGHEVKVGSVEAGDLFGEMALILNQPRTATIRAAEPLKVLKIDGDVFLRLVTENADASLAVMRSLSDKVSRMTERYEQLQRQLGEKGAPSRRTDPER